MSHNLAELVPDDVIAIYLEGIGNATHGRGTKKGSWASIVRNLREPLVFGNTRSNYSIVTFTTLGFGDIKPENMTAAWWVMAEEIVGYVMLGGLISILATKLARRS